MAASGTMGQMGNGFSRPLVSAEAADNAEEKHLRHGWKRVERGGTGGLFLVASKTRRFPDLRPISF